MKTWNVSFWGEKKTWLSDRKESIKTWNASFWGEKKNHGCLTEKNLWKPEMPHFEEKKTWLSDRKESMKTWNASFWGEKNMAVWQKKIYENLKCLILRRKKHGCLTEKNLWKPEMSHFEEKKKPMAVWQKRIYENLKCLILRRKKNMAAWQKRIYENLKCLILRRKKKHGCLTEKNLWKPEMPHFEEKKKPWLSDRKESMKTWNASFWGEEKQQRQTPSINSPCCCEAPFTCSKLALWKVCLQFTTNTHTHTHTHTHPTHTHTPHTCIHTQRLNSSVGNKNKLLQWSKAPIRLKNW